MSRAMGAVAQTVHVAGARRRWGIALALCAACLLIAPAAAQAATVGRSSASGFQWSGLGASGQSFGVALIAPQIAAQAGLSTAQVLKGVAVQGLFPDIVNTLENVLGSGFAGVWFDGSTGRFEVGVVPSTNAAAADATLASHGVLNDSDLVPVRSTWAELQAVEAALVAKDTALLRAGQAVIGLDPERNAVEVELSRSTSAATVAAQASVALASSVSVYVRQVPAPTLYSTVTTCAIPFCGTPLRGGVEVYDNAAGCSAGFVAESTSSPGWYVMTAGHCDVYGGGNGVQWQTALPSTNPPTQNCIGRMINYTYGASGDAAIIEISCGPFAPSGFVPLETHLWGFGDVPQDTGAITAYPGEYACDSGWSSAEQLGDSQCGTVIGPVYGSTPECETYPNTNTCIPGTNVVVGNASEASWCVQHGDSGAGVVSVGSQPGDGAIGIMSATGPYGPCPNADSWFTEATSDEGALGVYIPPES